MGLLLRRHGLIVLGVIGVYNSREYGIEGSGGGSGQRPSRWPLPGSRLCSMPAASCCRHQDNKDLTASPPTATALSTPTDHEIGGRQERHPGQVRQRVGMLLTPVSSKSRRASTRPVTHARANGRGLRRDLGSPAEPVQDGYLQTKKAHGGREDTCNPDCESGVRLENDQLVTIAFLPAPPKHGTPDILQPPAAVIARSPSSSVPGHDHDDAPTALPTTSAPRPRRARREGRH